jgi:hypothetical protein
MFAKLIETPSWPHLLLAMLGTDLGTDQTEIDAKQRDVVKPAKRPTAIALLV